MNIFSSISTRTQYGVGGRTLNPKPDLADGKEGPETPKPQTLNRPFEIVGEEVVRLSWAQAGRDRLKQVAGWDIRRVEGSGFRV